MSSKSSNAKASPALADRQFQPCAVAATVHARFLLQGPADPGLLPRLLEPFAKLGTVPTRVHATREAGDGTEMNVDLRLSDVAQRTAELIEIALRRVIGVNQLIAVIEAAD